ncbi:uncharacterized protein LOC133396723 [Phycodurus eques]|uniref:uncharacterized protein LOC133396723 n=1 Tax=Phycodurus eques TaxID=693459 RepID=UPI002ACED6B4|nr:uncharacterized protein LOC133396723 [Phycodurus eques]
MLLGSPTDRCSASSSPAEKQPSFKKEKHNKNVPPYHRRLSYERPGQAAFIGPEATSLGPRLTSSRTLRGGSAPMGTSCCRPESPCGSAEERSGLLKDDAKAVGAAGHMAAAAATGGTWGPQGDDNIRKTTDDVTIKAEAVDGVQVTVLPESGASEPIIARENGSLQREAVPSSALSPNKAATLEEHAIGEENMGTFMDKNRSSELLQEVNYQREDGDRHRASSTQDKMQDGGMQEAQMSPRKDANMPDVCRRDDGGSKGANTFTLLMELRRKNKEASSSRNTQGAPMAATCQENTFEPNCLLNEDSEDSNSSALRSGQDEKGHDASVEPTEAKLGGEERRPAHFNDVETLTTTPEDASSPHAAKENQQENIYQYAVEDQDGGHPAAMEGEERMEEVEKMEGEEKIMEEVENEPMEVEEKTGGTPQGLVEEVRPAESSLRSSEEDLYRAEELPSSHNDTRAAPLETTTLEARCSLGPAVDILFYSEREWRGNTAKSALIRKGYKELSQCFAGVRQVRGDNYCALRATLFQVLSQASQVPAWLQEDHDDVDELSQELSELMAQWTFPGEDQAQPHVTRRLQSYLEILRNKWRAAVCCPSPADRQQLCDDAFQGGEEELAMLEALKLLMLRRAAQLNAGMRAGRDVPLFCWLLFARDSSDCPSTFLANHLSRVGVSAGLEQVEMCLLGDALRCTLQVYRLYMADTEEFVAYYPDEHKDDWPRVSLVTEDDRHYNVPVAKVAEKENEEMEEEEVAAAS